MSDHKQWYKTWTCILNDPEHMDMSCKQVGQWTRLLAFVASAGERGKWRIRKPAKQVLLAMECKTFEELQEVLLSLVNVQLDPPLDGHDTITVTIKNWYKYQVDPTHNERKRRARAREEEKREEVRKEEKEEKKGGVIAPAPAYPKGPMPTQSPEEITARVRRVFPSPSMSLPKSNVFRESLPGDDEILTGDDFSKMKEAIKRPVGRNDDDDDEFPAPLDSSFEMPSGKPQA